MGNSDQIRLLLADELALVREGIARLCENTGRFEAIEQVADGATAWQVIEAVKPDLALVDFGIPKLFSLELVRRVRDANLPTRLILMSGRGDRKMALEALRAVANGFLLKSAAPSQLLDALIQVLAGSIYVSPDLHFERIFLSGKRNGSEDPLESLSSREYQVFQLLIDGIRAKEIASRLNLSPKTVDTYRASLMRKLDIYDVAGLVKFAIQRELIHT